MHACMSIEITVVSLMFIPVRLRGRICAAERFVSARNAFIQARLSMLSLEECMHDTQSHAMATYHYSIDKIGICGATTARIKESG